MVHCEVVIRVDSVVNFQQTGGEGILLEGQCSSEVIAAVYLPHFREALHVVY